MMSPPPSRALPHPDFFRPARPYWTARPGKSPATTHASCARIHRPTVGDGGNSGGLHHRDSGVPWRRPFRSRPRV
jgi:hypothetical protein